MITCHECPKHEYCPLGTVSPLPKKELTPKTGQFPFPDLVQPSIQEQFLMQLIKPLSISFYLCIAAIANFFVILLLLALCKCRDWVWLENRIKYMDIFKSKEREHLNHYYKTKNTVIGGLLSIAMAMFIIIGKPEKLF